ncbi:hypothetical protein JCM11491_002096 [Sporobolomyces phaffii]
MLRACSRRTMTTSTFPAYLVHAPFLSVEPRPSSSSSSSESHAGAQLLQRTLPPSPLYYLHAAPRTVPGAAPPVLSLAPSVSPSSSAVVRGRISTVYRATSLASGTRVVLKYAPASAPEHALALATEAENVYVNLPHGVGLPIPTYYGQFLGAVEQDQPPGIVTVLEDCGEPIATFQGDLSRAERKTLYDALETLHGIHFSIGHFSPASVVVSSSAPVESDSTTTTPSPRRVTLVGFSQAEWHLCPGESTCRELVDAKRALGLS